MRIETRFRCGLSVLTAVVAILLAGITSAQTVQSSQPDRTVIPLAEPGFEGTIGETYKDSTAAWPKLPAPPAGAPNVVVIPCNILLSVIFAGLFRCLRRRPTA